jgi:hypothetical protein
MELLVEHHEPRHLDTARLGIPPMTGLHQPKVSTGLTTRP